MTEPRTAAGLGSVLHNRDLLSNILEYVDPQDCHAIRCTSKSICSTYNSCVDLLQLRQSAFTSLDEAQHRLARLLQRGCTPESVCIGTDDNTPPELQQAYGDAFFRAFATAPPAPLHTCCLRLQLAALTSETAGLVAAAFNQLNRLALVDGLVDPSSDQAPAWAPLLPAFLETLRQELPGATQLTGLSAAFVLTEPDHVSAISKLISLKNLGIVALRAELLPALLTPLTVLKDLILGATSGPLPGAPLCALSGLTSLQAACATLDLHTLSQLTRLTSLEVHTLVLPEASVAAGRADGHPSSYLLPPNLGKVEAACVAPEALHALRASPVRQLTWQIGVVLDRGPHYDAASSALTERGEAGLCNVAAFLEGRMDAWSEVWIGTEDNKLLWPVGGEVGPGLGRRNHTAWLEAFGRAGVPCLTFDHIALSHQDLGTLSAAHPGLKRLDLSDGTQYPMRGLLVLPRAPALELLTLDVGAWCGPDRDGPLEPPADMEVVLQAELVAKPGLWVQLCCAHEVAEEVAEQVQDLAAEVEDELVEIGDPEPRRLEVELRVKAGVEGGG